MMTKKTIKTFFWLIALLLCSAGSAYAVETDKDLHNSELLNPSKRKFIKLAWGIDIGSSIDMTTQDMSTLNADAFVGIRAGWLDVLGIGAGLHAMVNNNSYSYPVYAIARTSFSSRPRLCFFEVRTGIAVNHFFDTPASTAFYINPSVGFNLAVGSKYRTFISVGYCYDGGRLHSTTADYPSISPLSFANVRLGIAF